MDALIPNILDGYPTVSASNATWLPNTGATAQTSNCNFNYAFPVIGIQLSVASGGSSGAVIMTLIQAGI